MTEMSILARLFSLEGKTAFVTGGATGIGRMITTALTGAGATVMIASRKLEACRKTADEINAEGHPGTVEAFAGDVATEDGVKALADEVRTRTDRLDILFNNAGVSWGAPLEQFPYHAWQKVFSVNVAGLFAMTQQLLPLLDKAATLQDPARIVNLGSVMGAAPLGENVYSYASSKAAVHHLTRCLAKEFSGRHITVNAFAPGPFQSKMTDFATGTDEKAAKVGAGVPMGRIGSPDDIAGAALFLCGRGGAICHGGDPAARRRHRGRDRARTVSGGLMSAASAAAAATETRLRESLVSLAEYRSHLGGEELLSDWLTVDQAMIDTFADATHDHQFIHVDPERAKAETPFGGTIAHGFLTLSLLSTLAYTALPGVVGTRMGINYGFEKVRFLSPVKAGARVRGRFRMIELKERAVSLQTSWESTVEIEKAIKPALSAHWITLAVLDAPAE